MAVEQTLSIIKPDGVKKGVMGEIIKRFESSGLNVVAIKMKTLSLHEAQGFYAVHQERPFFGELVEFMTSGPVVLMILEGENAIARNREIMGATNPADAAEGTIRRDFATNIGENTVHGSDATDTAHFETNWFFAGTEINTVVRL
jgi:nucleoside-diphosphate kinase